MRWRFFTGRGFSLSSAAQGTMGGIDGREGQKAISCRRRSVPGGDLSPYKSCGVLTLSIQTAMSAMLVGLMGNGMGIAGQLAIGMRLFSDYSVIIAYVLLHTSSKE